jgi:hypothetical protein
LLNTLLGTLSSGVAAATGSYESIATLTGTGSETTLNFTSIPGTYSHLQIRWTAKDIITGAAADNGIAFQLNGLGGTNYAYHRLKGNGTAASATGFASQPYFETDYGDTDSPAGAANMFAAGIFDLIDYASTTKYKTVRVFSGSNINTASTAYGVNLTSGLIMTTNAITSILIYTSGSAFASGTQFALYGIKG